jgi:hypothetical protein
MLDMASHTGTVDLKGAWENIRVGDKLYTRSEPQQPLSDAKIDATSQSIWGEMNGLPLERCRLFARGIEAAYGIKETP